MGIQNAHNHSALRSTNHFKRGTPNEWPIANSPNDPLGKVCAIINPLLKPFKIKCSAGPIT